MPEINFLVAGSAAEPYEVTFLKTADGVVVLCTCPAGENRRHCKHRIALLNGSTEGVVSGNRDEIAAARRWIAGTAVESALQAFNSVPPGDKDKRLAAARRLARAMDG